MENANMSVIRAIDILELLIVSNQRLSITDISKELSLNRVTCTNLLKTLLQKRYVYRDQNGKYTVTGKIFVLGTVYKNNFPIAKPFEEIGSILAKEFDVDVILSVMCDVNKAVVLTQLPQYSEYLRATDVYIPLHCTANGKIFLAFGEEKKTHSMIHTMEMIRYTNSTITEPERLCQELESIKANGYSVDNREYIEKRICIGAPVFEHGNHVTAAISFSSYEKHSLEHMLSLLPHLQDLANTLSRSMGYRKVFLDNI